MTILNATRIHFCVCAFVLFVLAHVMCACVCVRAFACVEHVWFLRRGGARMAQGEAPCECAFRSPQRESLSIATQLPFCTFGKERRNEREHEMH